MLVFAMLIFYFSFYFVCLKGEIAYRFIVDRVNDRRSRIVRIWPRKEGGKVPNWTVITFYLRSSLLFCIFFLFLCFINKIFVTCVLFIMYNLLLRINSPLRMRRKKQSELWHDRCRNNSKSRNAPLESQLFCSMNNLKKKLFFLNEN